MPYDLCRLVNVGFNYTFLLCLTNNIATRHGTIKMVISLTKSIDITKERYKIMLLSVSDTKASDATGHLMIAVYISLPVGIIVASCAVITMCVILR